MPKYQPGPKSEKRRRRSKFTKKSLAQRKKQPKVSHFRAKSQHKKYNFNGSKPEVTADRSRSRSKSKTNRKLKSKTVKKNPKPKVLSSRKRKITKAGKTPSTAKASSRLSGALRTINSISSTKFNPEDFNQELSKLNDIKIHSPMSGELDQLSLNGLRQRQLSEQFIREDTARNLGLFSGNTNQKQTSIEKLPKSGVDQSQLSMLLQRFEKMQQQVEQLSKQNKQILGEESVKQSQASLEQGAKANVEDSYVGDINSSLLNRKVIENGEDRNSFVRRGTLVINASGKSINESLGPAFQLDPDAVIPEESMENAEVFEGGRTPEGSTSKTRNKIFENINATRDNSARDLRVSPHTSSPANPFNPLFNPPVERRETDYNRIIVSESEKLDSEEEDKLEKSLIEENINRIGRSKTRRGKTFNETMSNIYDDLDKTFDQIDLKDMEKEYKEQHESEKKREKPVSEEDEEQQIKNLIIPKMNDRYKKSETIEPDVDQDSVKEPPKAKSQLYRQSKQQKFRNKKPKKSKIREN